MLRPSEVKRTEAAGALGAWGRRPVSGGAAGRDPSPPRKLPARRRRLGGNAQPRGSPLSGCGVREDPVCGPGLSDAHAGPRAGTVCWTCTATSPAVSGSFSRRSARRACAPATAQRPRCGRRGSLTRARGWTGSAPLPHEGETSCSKGRVRLWRTAAPSPPPKAAFVQGTEEAILQHSGPAARPPLPAQRARIDRHCGDRFNVSRRFNHVFFPVCLQSFFFCLPRSRLSASELVQITLFSICIVFKK